MTAQLPDVYVSDRGAVLVVGGNCRRLESVLRYYGAHKGGDMCWRIGRRTLAVVETFTGYVVRRHQGSWHDAR